LFDSGVDTLGNPLAYPNDAAAHISGAVLTLPPGDSTGWHRHRVPTVGYLVAGELTIEYATGETRVFAAGDGFIEAQNVAHNGHNRGTEPVRVFVAYAGADGVPTAEPADPPPAGQIAERTPDRSDPVSQPSPASVSAMAFDLSHLGSRLR
jgi:quercetin dioxygenase-like cupin family protein